MLVSELLLTFVCTVCRLIELTIENKEYQDKVSSLEIEVRVLCTWCTYIATLLCLLHHDDINSKLYYVNHGFMFNTMELHTNLENLGCPEPILT